MMAWLGLFGIPILAMLLVLRDRARPQTLAAVVVGGWLFMPLVATSVSGLPGIYKATLLGTAVLVAALIARSEALSRIRPSWYDLPVLCWSVAPMFSSLSNGLGTYDGYIAATTQTLIWGVPYLLGRAFFVDAAAFTAMARALLVGAAVYAPLCLLESRLAPQLHGWVFGVPGRANWESVSFYGPLRFKASVFMESPIELTLVMGIGFLAGCWLLRHRLLDPITGIGRLPLLGLALLATLMGKSLGGVTLTLVGLVALSLIWRFRTRTVLVVLMSIAPLYIVTRTAGVWSGNQLVEFVTTNISESRGRSLEFRLINEDLLLEKALEQPVFGWGGWGRNRVYDEEGKDISITDGLWIVVLGCGGWFGLVSWLLLNLLPCALAWSRLRSPPDWETARAPALAFAAVILGLHTIDSLPNAMVNPMYGMLAGGLTTLATRRAPHHASLPDPALAPPAGPAASRAHHGLVPRGRAGSRPQITPRPKRRSPLVPRRSRD